MATARSLAVDGWTTEAMAALSRAGVEALLLKGPVLTRWLYDPGDERGYADADVLVAPGAITSAEAVLERLGYALKDREGEESRLISGPHAQTWWRESDGALVDLHHTLPGQVLAEDLVWNELSRRAVALPLGGGAVRALDEPSRAVLVALHAVHHGPDHPASMDDLRRAAVRVPDAIWKEAAGIAQAIVALPRFAEGLALLPESREVAARLRLPDSDVLAALERNNLASGWERLSRADGIGARVRLVWRELFPTPAFMHWWAPRARRSRLALAAAYVYRLGWLAVHVAPGWRAWRRTRARTR
jgi:hypothetical protein